jgi:hypothetical protein
MSSDLESRLQRQLAARADAVPSADRLDVVVAKGRRRQVRSRVAMSMVGLLILGGGATAIALNEQNQSTFTVSEDPADGEQTDGDVDGDGNPAEDSEQPTTTVAQDQEQDQDEGQSENQGDGTGSEDAAPDGATIDDGNGEDPAPDAAPADSGDLIAIDDLSYAGAFRVSSETFGASSTNYSVGALAYNAEKNSVFIAGHSQDKAIAEFAIPTLGTSTTMTDLPEVPQPLQPFSTIFDRVANPGAIDTITGMYVVDGQLMVNAENRQDASGPAEDTTLVIADADALDGAISDFYQLPGGAIAGGYISPVPAQWQDALGGTALTGWASNYGIVSRYSIGPSMFGFSPESVVAAGPGPIATTEHMAFPFAGDNFLVPDARAQTEGTATQTWNPLSRGVYGFIVPGSRTFAVVGSNGGVASGVGEGITQIDGTVCNGSCPYDPDDFYNYYWLFDLDEILAAGDSADPTPYAHGRWDVPFDDGGQHLIVGATLDPERGLLYMALSEAGALQGTFETSPVIVAYRVS